MTTREAPAAGGMRGAGLPLALLVVLGTGWGLSFSLAKIATSAGVHPLGMMLWQAGGAAAIVLGFCALRGRLRQISLQHWRYYLACSALGTLLPSAVIYSAAPHVPAGVMAILLTVSPMVTYAVALTARIERFSGVRIAGIGLGFVAVVLIVGPRASLPDPAMAGWVMLGLAAPFCYAAQTVVIATFRPAASDSSALAAGMLITGTAALAPVVALTGTGHMVGAPWDAVDAAVVGTPLITGAAHIVMFELIHSAGPVFFSQVGYLITAAGVLWGMALFGERHSPWIWVALVLMFAGLALVNWRRAAAAPPARRRSPEP